VPTEAWDPSPWRSEPLSSSTNTPGSPAKPSLFQRLKRRLSATGERVTVPNAPPPTVTIPNAEISTTSPNSPMPANSPKPLDSSPSMQSFTEVKDGALIRHSVKVAAAVNQKMDEYQRPVMTSVQVQQMKDKWRKKQEANLSIDDTDSHSKNKILRVWGKRGICQLYALTYRKDRTPSPTRTLSPTRAASPGRASRKFSLASDGGAGALEGPQTPTSQLRKPRRWSIAVDTFGPAEESMWLRRSPSGRGSSEGRTPPRFRRQSVAGEGPPDDSSPPRWRPPSRGSTTPLSGAGGSPPRFRMPSLGTDSWGAGDDFDLRLSLNHGLDTPLSLRGRRSAGGDTPLGAGGWAPSPMSWASAGKLSSPFSLGPLKVRGGREAPDVGGAEAPAPLAASLVDVDDSATSMV